MGRLLAFLLSLTMVFGPYQNLSPIPMLRWQHIKNNRSKIIESMQVTGPEELVVEEEVEEDPGYTISNFTTFTFGGYASINVPLSHFTMEQSNDERTNFVYKDLKTRLVCGYKREIPAGTDMNGYVANELAGINTVTNDNSAVKYNGVDWVKIVAERKDENVQNYIFYTTNSSKTSVFYASCSEHLETDDNELQYVLKKIFETYQLMANTDSVFKTPTTGLYAGTTGDNEYQARDDEHKVFEDRGGFVKADIADNWDSLELVIDDQWIKLPCKMKDLQNMNYEINDYNIKREDIALHQGYFGIEMINNKGTVINVGVYNPSVNEDKQLEEIDVVALKIDKNKLVTLTEKEAYTGDEPEEIEEETQELEEEDSEEGEEEQEESEDDQEGEEQPEEIEERPDLDENGQRTKESIAEQAAKASDIINSRGTGQDMEIVSDHEVAPSVSEMKEERKKEYAAEQQRVAKGEKVDSDFSKAELDRLGVDENERLSSEKKSDNYVKETDLSKHILVLPGGATWDVYKSDLLVLYGKEESIEKASNKETILWLKNDAYMLVDIGNVKDINSVEIGSMPMYRGKL